MRRSFLLLGGVALVALLRGAPAPSPTSEAVTLAMLGNIRDHGTNPAALDGLGGLWVNWRPGTQPLQVNFNGSGEPDGAKVSPPRHDPLTDLRYLHNLLSWKHQHPADPQFDDELKRYTAVVQRQFANTKDERGWLYDELIDMARLSGDAFFRETARTLAASYAAKVHDDIGAIYKTRAEKPRGYYRVDLALETGCALVQAGTVFKRPEWQAKGERLVDFVYAHAYLREYRLFATQMDEVRLADGSANPDQKFYREPFRHYQVNGGVVRFGGLGQLVLSLLHTGVVTGDPKWLDRANEILEPLTARTNTLGLWDAKHGGYFAGVQFDGPGFSNPGKPKLLTKSKESGRQFHMLQAFHVANVMTKGRYRDMEEALTRVLVEKAYYAPARGIFYESESDWTPRKTKAGPADWVTTEAMGCAMMALFSLNEKEPW